MYFKSKNPFVKFEQSLIHKEYLFHLYELFKNNTFNERKTNGIIKSYSFRTFSHKTFLSLWNFLSLIGLAYWIIDDGSLEKYGKRLILNTQS